MEDLSADPRTSEGAVRTLQEQEDIQDRGELPLPGVHTRRNVTNGIHTPWSYTTDTVKQANSSAPGNRPDTGRTNKQKQMETRTQDVS